MPAALPADSPPPQNDVVLLGGARLVADPSGALMWPEEGLLIVADLHLEKGSSFARRGQLLPPYDTSATLARLEAVLARHRPKRVVSLGDGFHDAEASGRLARPDRDRLARLIAAHDWCWVLGNHDPVPPSGLGGRIERAIEWGPLLFRHRPEAELGDGFEVAGHLHPAARIKIRGRAVSRPCFVSDRRRILLPAFGSFTGGLSVADPAIAGLFAEPPAVRMLGRRAVYLVRGSCAKRKAAGGPPRSEETETLRIEHWRASEAGRL